MSAPSLLSRSIRSSTSHSFSFSPLHAQHVQNVSMRRCLHATPPALARKSKKWRKPVNPEAMTVPDAFFLLKSVEVAHPNNAIELHVKTKFKRGEGPSLRGRLNMPRDPRTSETRLLVFCEPSDVQKALQAGATWAGGEELVEEVMAGRIQPTAVLAHPSLLGPIARLGRTLGPKGLMPNAKRGTVVEDVVPAVQEAKGLFTWKGDRLGNVRAKVGRVNFETEEVEANVRAFLANVREGGGAVRASYEKGKTYEILQVHMSSTQGPGIELRDFAQQVRQ